MTSFEGLSISGIAKSKSLLDASSERNNKWGIQSYYIPKQIRREP
jgi:hypothetical protein